MKILDKKIPLVYALAALFFFCALVYSLGYKVAMDKFNNVVSYAYEKQKMYSTLSEVDYNIREDCVCDIKNSDILTEICKGYAFGVDSENCKFFNKSEYKKYLENSNKDVSDINFDKLDSDILYIKCNAIFENAAKSIKENITKALSDGTRGLIIDLRNCSKADSSEVFKIIQNIVPTEDIIKTLDKKGKSEIACKSEGTGLNLKISVIVNSGTSGACELIASSLKDKRNVTLVGTKTAGNTVRLKTVTLADDSVLIFPDAYYLNTDGENLFKKGVLPNEEVLADENNSEDLQLRSAIKNLD